ncbi:hypothetical protein GCM10010317_011110 [Streptomyces mirabilis]|nr:hypothetical protein GCM10010317_011110 [Streptomyces mirabilis]
MVRPFGGGGGREGAQGPVEQGHRQEQRGSGEHEEGQVVQAPGVGAMGEDGRVGGGGDHRAEVHEGAQESGRGAHAGGVGLPVEGVLVGEAVEALRDAHDDPDGAEQPDRTAGVRAQQRGTAGDLHQTAHDELAPDRLAAPGDGGDGQRAERQGQQYESGGGGGQVPPLLQPLREAVQERVRRREAEELTQEGRQHGDVAAEHPQVDERLRDANLPQGEGRCRADGEDEQPPVVGPRFHQEEHEGGEQAGEQRHAERIDAPPLSPPARALRQPQHTEDQTGPRQRHVDEEDGAPAAHADQQSAQGGADDGDGLGGDGERGQHSGRAVPPGALGLTAGEAHRGGVGGGGADS